MGTEVKSIRLGQLNKGAASSNSEIFVRMHVSPYEKGNIFNEDPIRRADCSCIRRFKAVCGGEAGRNTLVPLEIYFRNGKIKLKSACAKERSYMTSAKALKKEVEKEINRELRGDLGVKRIGSKGDLGSKEKIGK